MYGAWVALVSSNFPNAVNYFISKKFSGENNLL